MKMDLNLDSLSDVPFNFNENGLILLKDTLEAVQIAFCKVRFLKGYINDQLTLSKKILAQDDIKVNSNVDKTVTSIPEVSEKASEKSVEGPCTNIPWNQNLPPLDNHVLSSTKSFYSMDVSTINQGNSVEDLKVSVSIPIRLKRVKYSLTKLFVRKKFKNFKIISGRRTNKRSTAKISFTDVKDFNRALDLNCKLNIRNVAVNIQPYAKTSENTQCTNFQRKISKSKAAKKQKRLENKISSIVKKQVQEIVEKQKSNPFGQTKKPRPKKKYNTANKGKN